MYSQIAKHQRHYRRFGRDPTLHSDESVFKAVPHLNMCHVFEYKLCRFKQNVICTFDCDRDCNPLVVGSGLCVDDRPIVLRARRALRSLLDIAGGRLFVA